MDLRVGEQRYQLRLSINTICELEEETGKRFDELAQTVEDGSMRTARLLVWGALREAHPDLTLHDVGEIMTTAGLRDVTAALMEAIRAAFPQPAPRKPKMVKRA